MTVDTEFCRWYEAIDRKAGRPPAVRATENMVTYELSVLGGILRNELFNPMPRTRIVIRCERSGEIMVRILNGRSSGA